MGLIQRNGKQGEKKKLIHMAAALECVFDQLYVELKSHSVPDV